MADNNKVLIEVVVTDKGLRLSQKNLEGLNESISNTSKKTKEAKGRSEDLFNTQNKGIIGTANSTKSFSKLAETIGTGGGGLVGAYATLAANAFAVSAAFVSLRAGAQVNQVLKGLELQGARTGNALTLTAKGIQDITKGALSASDAMSAAALGTSAGLGRKDIEELTKIATNASLALGRSIPDSMDRVIKGVTKLEPELLDELGLMTKLTEASENYARANGKTAASLTNFEKRMAFVQAIQNEGKSKFDGIADSIGVNQLDKLGATFTNLAHSMAGSVATATTTNAVISTLTDSSYGLYGALLLLGSYVARQYTSSLRASSIQTLAASKALDEKARSLKDITKQRIGDTKAILEGTKAEMKAATAMSKPLTNKVAKQNMSSALSGDAKAQDAVIKSREASNKRYEKQLKDLTGKDDYASKKKIQNANDQIIANKLQIEAMKAMQTANSAYTKAVVQNAQTELRTRAAQQGSLAQGRAGLAMDAAGALKLGQAYRNVISSASSYNQQLTLTAQAASNAAAAAALNGKSTTFMASALNLVGPAALKARVGMYALTLGVKAVGIAFATALPWIGVITIALSMAQAAYENFFKTKETKAKEKALDDLNTVLDNTYSSIKELERVQKSVNGTMGDNALKSITIQANAMVQLIDSYQEFSKTSADLERNLKGVSTSDYFSKVTPEQLLKDLNPLRTFDPVLKFAAPSIDKAAFKKELGLVTDIAAEAGMKMVSDLDQFTDLFFGNGVSDSEEAILKTLDTLASFDSELAKSVKITGDAEQSQINLSRVLKVAAPYWNRLKIEAQSFTESIKAAETAQLDFISSISAKTKFDGVTEAFGSLNQSISALKETMSSGGSFDGQQFEELLAGIGPATQRILDFSDQTKLDEVRAKYQDINRISQEIIQLEKEGLGSTDSATQALAQRDKLQSSIKTTIIEIAPHIQEATKNYENQLRIDRIRSITLQSMITLEQARLEKLQRQGTVVASDLKRQIDSQNKVKQLQIQQVTLESKYLEMQALRDQFKLNELKTTYEQIKAGNIQLTQAEKMTEESLRQQKSRQETLLTDYKAKDPLFEATSPQLANELKSQIQSTQTALDELTSPEKALKRQQDLIALQEKSLELVEAQVSASRASADAIQLSIVGPAEAGLQAQELTIQNSKELAASLLNIESINQENQRTIDKTNALISGRAEFLYEEIKALKEQSKERQKSLALTSAANIAELERLKALASKAGKVEYQNRITVAKEEYRASVQLEASKTRLEVLQKGINLTIEDGIKSQQDSLAILQKQMELTDDILSANLELEKTRARIAAKRVGGEVDPITEFILSKRAAELEYQTALNNYDIRILGIDAEYDLLEAQRIGQAASLKASALTLEATLQATGGINSSQRSTIDSVLSAANRLETSSYDTARFQAKELAKLGLEKLRLAKEEASIFSNGGGSAIVAAAVNIGNILKGVKAPDAPDSVKIVSPDIQAIKSVASEQLKATMLLVEEIKKAGFSQVAINLDQLVATIRTEQNSRTAAQAVTSSMPMTNSATDMARYVQTNYSGAKVSEIAGFGRGKNPTSGHSNGSKHYVGEAFDVNMVAGQDANNPAAKAALDSMAKDLSSKGMEVLWNGWIYQAGAAVSRIRAGSHQHRDHLHAEIEKSIQPVVTRIIDTVTSGASSGANRAAQETKPLKSSYVKPQSNLVANDNESIDLGDMVTKNISLMDSLFESQKRNKIGLKEYGFLAASIFSGFSSDLEKLKGSLDAVGQARADVAIAISNMMVNLTTLVPQTIEILTTSFDQFKSKNVEMLEGVDAGTQKTMYKAQQLSAAFAAAAQVIAGVNAILQAQSAAKIAAVDKEISAEQKRDGKSAQSVAKLEALEKKKDAMAKKAFNTNKKMMMAQAVMSTAAGIAGALGSNPGITGIILAGIIGAMGAAQIAIIAGTQYESASSAKSISTPSAISIGKRSDTVDLAKGPNANAGGEAGYLRGSQGSGSNASNYNTVGSAYGGELMRGYGNRGFIVGEKGPERINPETPITVTPANDVGTQQPLNATFNIQALDSSGVQDLLVAQKGNIIKMLRDAANASGKSFMEDVNTNVYLRPSVGKL